VRWTEPGALQGSDALFKTVRDTPVARDEILRSVGDPGPILSGAAHKLTATYQWPISRTHPWGRPAPSPMCVRTVRRSGARRNPHTATAGIFPPFSDCPSTASA